MADWKSRQHEVSFNETLRELVKSYLATSEADIEKSIENITADGRKFSIRFSDYYDAYTFSITFPKTDKRIGGHTYWFVHADLTKGVSVAEWLFEEIRHDKLQDLNGSLDKYSW